MDPGHCLVFNGTGQQAKEACLGQYRRQRKKKNILQQAGLAFCKIEAAQILVLEEWPERLITNGPSNLASPFRKARIGPRDIRWYFCAAGLRHLRNSHQVTSSIPVVRFHRKPWATGSRSG